VSVDIHICLGATQGDDMGGNEGRRGGDKGKAAIKLLLRGGDQGGKCNGGREENKK